MAGTVKCDKCGEEYREGEWPYCPHGSIHGQHGRYSEYYDDHIAPEPSPDFKPAPGVTLPEYVPGKGYRITPSGERRRLMHLAGLRERDGKRDIKEITEIRR